MIPIFDGHNDVLLRLMRKAEPDGGATSFLAGDGAGHLDLPRARAGGFVGGLFAVFVPPMELDAQRDDLMRQAEYDVPLPKGASLRTRKRSRFGWFRCFSGSRAAQKAPSASVAMSARSVRASRRARSPRSSTSKAPSRSTAISLCSKSSTRRALGRSGRSGAGRTSSGMASVSLPERARYRPRPDRRGRALVWACNELAVMIDLSHLNEKGFWDVAALSAAPLVATHSNVHALSRHSRNLTDRQLAAIRESGGLVGLNFAACFLRADGRMRAATPLEDMVRHTDYLIEHLGVEGVGFGSDFDGAVVPEELGAVVGLPRLVEAYRSAGYDDALLRKLGFENWLGVLERTRSARSSSGAGPSLKTFARDEHGGGMGIGDGAGAELARGHLFDHHAMLHDEKPLAQMRDDREVVADKDI
jgi:membrane dipeptidase